MKSSKKFDLIASCCFLVTLISFFYLFNFHEILRLSPKGIHFIRQTDSLSFAYQYYWKNHSFFNPHVFNLTSVEGRAACEFPLIYFVVAKLYSFFGESENIFRLFNLILFSSSLVFLQRSISHLGQIISILIPLCIISSTILLYYSCNFLPEISAFSFTIFALSMILFYQRKGLKSRYLIWAAIFLTLSALTKITYGIYGIALMITVTHLFWLKKIKKRNFLISLIIFLLHVSIVICWYAYATYYNNQSGDEYFLLKPRPFWETPHENWAGTFGFITTYWNSALYHPVIRWVFLITFFINLVFYWRSNTVVAVLLTNLFLGCLSIFVLFSVQLIDHDYYLICFIPAFLINIYFFFLSLEKKNKLRFVSTVTLVICIISGGVYAQKKLNYRYFANSEKQELISIQLKGGSDLLDQLGVTRDSKVLILGDNTRNGGLYFLKRNGYSYRADSISPKDNSIYQLLLKNEYVVIVDSTYSFVIEDHKERLKKIGTINKSGVYEMVN